MRASTCGINWRVTMTRGRLGRVESGMAADRARRGAAVKSRSYEKAGDERSLLRGERLKCGDEFDKAKRSEEHTSELQSLMRISYAVFCLKKKRKSNTRVNT